MWCLARITELPPPTLLKFEKSVTSAMFRKSLTGASHFSGEGARSCRATSSDGVQQSLWTNCILAAFKICAQKMSRDGGNLVPPFPIYSKILSFNYCNGAEIKTCCISPWQHLVHRDIHYKRISCSRNPTEIFWWLPSLVYSSVT